MNTDLYGLFLNINCFQVTAPSMNDPRCQASIITAVDNHATLAKDLEKLWNEVLPSIPFSPLKDGLRKDTESLHDILKEIRSLCQMGIGTKNIFCFLFNFKTWNILTCFLHF